MWRPSLGTGIQIDTTKTWLYHVVEFVGMLQFIMEHSAT